MNQYYTHYENWEDYQNGMWRKPVNSELQEQQAIEVLSDPLEAMTRVVNEWPISTMQNLTDKKSNRRSWLGQAACCIMHNVPESVTRSSWFKLSEEQRLNANNIAEKIIKEWERNYSESMFLMPQ